MGLLGNISKPASNTNNTASNSQTSTLLGTITQATQTVTGVVTSVYQTPLNLTVGVDVSKDPTTPGVSAIVTVAPETPPPAMGATVTIPAATVYIPAPSVPLPLTWDDLLTAQAGFGLAIEGALASRDFSEAHAAQIEFRFAALGKLVTAEGQSSANGYTVLGRHDPRRDVERYRAARRDFLTRASEDPSFA